MFSSLVLTLGAGYFYLDSLCNTFYSKRSNVITVEKKKAFSSKIVDEDMTSFGLFVKCVEKEKNHLQYFLKLSE